MSSEISTSEIPVTWRFDPLNELITSLKKAYRNGAYLAWLRKQKCFACPAHYDVTASHLGRSYHGLKNHDWAAVPMCGSCHWEWEYHRDKYKQKFREPTIEHCERYFQKFLAETGREDNRASKELM